MSPNPTWDKENRIRYWRHMQREARMHELYEYHDGDHGKVLDAVMKEWNWTVQQAYIATEFLFRPENTN